MIPTYDLTLPDGFLLDRLENLRRPGDFRHPHKHGFYEIIWIEEGVSDAIIDSHLISIKPGTLVVISPGSLYRMNPATVKGYSLAFTEAFLFSNAPDYGYTIPVLQPDDGSLAGLRLVLDSMLTETGRSDKKAAIICHLLVVFLDMIDRLVTGPDTDFKAAGRGLTFKKFKRLLDDNYKTEKNIYYYTDRLFLSLRELNAICREMTGRTAQELIRDRVFLEAKRMLIHADCNISDIAFDLQFKDPSCFVRQFRSQERLAPAAYRRAINLF